MKVQIITYEGPEHEEKVHEELDLVPSHIDANKVVFNLAYPLGDEGEEGEEDEGTTVFETITFSVGFGEVKGYIHPLSDGKFFYLSEEEWTQALTQS